MTQILIAIAVIILALWILGFIVHAVFLLLGAVFHYAWLIALVLIVIAIVNHNRTRARLP